MPQFTLKRPVAITPCRSETLLGPLLMDPLMAQELVNLVMAFNLKELKEMSAGMPAASMTMDKKVAIIEVSGPTTKYPTSMQAIIGGTSTLQVRRYLMKAMNDPSVGAILMPHDTPGGTVHGAFDFADTIAKVAKVKPVIAYGNGTMCSAGMLSSSQCNYVLATPETRVGSIGVKTVLRDTSKAAEMAGVKVIPIVTSAVKGGPEPGVPITKEMIADIKRQIQDAHSMFLKYVSDGRGLTTKAIDDLQAAVFQAEEGLRHGLIDEVGDEDRALAIAQDAAANPAKYLSRKRGEPIQSGTDKPTITNPSAARSTRTMLTPTQLEQAKKLPGASANMTAETADEELLKIATTLATPAPKLPKPMIDKAVRLSTKGIDGLLSAEKIGPEQATALKALVTAERINENGDVALTLEDVTTVLDLNKPAGLVEETTGGQPAPKNEPGKPGDDKTVTPERKARLMSYVGNGNGNGSAAK